MSKLITLVADWPLPSSATLGSSVRLKGIEREIRSRLPWAASKCVKAEAGGITLRMTKGATDEFNAARAKVSRVLGGIETLPILPREAEDILAISSRERHKWLKDGRLKSAGTRTVKLRGHSKAVTFHVFDPRDIEDVLDRDLPAIWREEDAEASAKKRRRGAAKAARTRAGVDAGKGADTTNGRNGATRLELQGWDEFAADGLLHDPS